MRHYLRYFGKKLGWTFLTLVVAVTLNFFLPRMVPGNPVDAIVTDLVQGISDENRVKEIYETFNSEFGVDKPLWHQYLIYVRNLLRGDLGTSFGQYPKKVKDILRNAIPWTVGLQLPAILVGWILGNVLGALAAYRRKLFDKIFMPLSLAISSFPFFVMALLMLYLFGMTLGWFPIGGAYAFDVLPSLSWRFIGSVLYHYALPFLSIVIVTIGTQAIGMRSMAIYELNSDYVLYSKLLGLEDKKVVRYVFRNAMLPQITGLALSLGTMVAGALIAEIVFNYPGIGTYMFSAIRQLDYPLISGCTLLVTVSVLVANFAIEVVYGFLDPRIKMAQLEDK
ncbi:ABC-type transporter, integral membrane subunit [Spirochaeta thermophila DSM 6578]|uniref:ABC-type transporter, integral membrane subunit n=1 Tax=Winmispira thermophila (strain ATCC 700085 / DSM 6578 / Z-1203) TaxID=869211 RepID=G0GB13_WINT7|nr:ABC transporter permease [Spirochaeta thermophila]AEJ61037.1 ABC-type transporter, integral membrane subunit [Spirochaeta thermophila DSM 6578]